MSTIPLSFQPPSTFPSLFQRFSERNHLLYPSTVCHFKNVLYYGNISNTFYTSAILIGLYYSLIRVYDIRVKFSPLSSEQIPSELHMERYMLGIKPFRQPCDAKETGRMTIRKLPNCALVSTA